MPNYCANDVYVQGPPDAVAALLAFVGADQPEPQFDFDAIVPYAEPFRQMDIEAAAFAWGVKEIDGAAELAYIEKYGHNKDGYNSGGYDWCCANWGTKWRASGVTRTDHAGVRISFTTAWSPPNPIIVALHRRFPETTLRVEYFERGVGIAGGFACQSKADHDDYDRKHEWQAGTLSDEWQTNEYKGHRGG